MEMNAKWLTVRAGKKLCLLAKDELAYYIIEVGKNLDYAIEKRLKQQGISEVLLKELKLSFEYIPKKQIRGVAISGSTVRQPVILYLKSNKRKLVLQRDYDSDWLESFFEEIPRFTAPKMKPDKSEDQWDANQNRDLFNKLAFVPPTCLVAGLIGSVGFYGTRHWAFFTLCLILLVLQFGLMIAMPAYFTFDRPKGSKRKYVWELWLPISIITLSFLLIPINFLNDRDFWICTVIGIIVAFVLSGQIEYFYNHKEWLLGVLIFGIVGGWSIIGLANEVYALTEPSSYILEVEELDRSGSKRKHYECTVVLPDGRKESLHISGKLYYKLDEGDNVRVEHGTGLFGIEYANVYPLE